MNAKNLGRPKTDPSRDLKRDLLLQSRQLLDEGGPAALSMREVARRANCTHQAPYYYFENREAILASLVTDGFDALALCLKEANDLSATEGVRAALLASGVAYIGFALAQPGVFRIMFRPEVCDPSRFPDVQAAGVRAKFELDRLSTIVGGNKAQATMAAILWAHVHGMACLLLDGPLAVQFETEFQRTHYLRSVGEQFANLVLRKEVPSKPKSAVRAPSLSRPAPGLLIET
jgi:AcrR family transcriptional regulator